MFIDSISLYTVEMTLRDPFTTATESQTSRTLLIVSVTSGDLVGWGECSADGSAYCRGEDAGTARMALGGVARSRIGDLVEEPAPLAELVASPMAAAALDAARWDLYAKTIGAPLVNALGGSLKRVRSRAVLARSTDLLARADQAVTDGYRSIKIKLSPTDDLTDLHTIRSTHPAVGIAVDFNGSASRHRPPSSYWEQLDDLNLEFVEQPFDPSDQSASLGLVATSQTPICLDESVRNADQASWAIDHGFVVNLKAAKFGGPSRARVIARTCPDGQAWWGGMLETGIGRAHALALATMSGPTVASDLGASNRYYATDLTDPFELDEGGIKPSTLPGIGVTVDTEILEALSTVSPDRYS
jgi:O-succinylbenzoate synthase